MRIKRQALITKVEEVAYHRNGICGEPFRVVTFTHRVGGEHHPRRMVGIVFSAQGRVAVFDREALGDGAIAFGGTDDGQNSWRGDNFERELRAAIAATEQPEVDEFPVTLPNGRRARVTVPPSNNF